MRTLFFIIFLLSLANEGISQDTIFKLKKFDYSSLKEKENCECNDEVISQIEIGYQQIESLRSELSVQTSEKIYKENRNCWQSGDIFALCLFRHGDWLKAIDVIDSAILIFGANPNLIYRKVYMNLEMAELGVGIRQIDGNSVYLPTQKQLPYNDSLFKLENYHAALEDFMYLSTLSSNNQRDIYAIGYIYQCMNEFEKSNEYFLKLIDFTEFADYVNSSIINNYILLKDINKAYELLKQIENQNHRSVFLYQKYYELAQIEGDSVKMKDYEKKYNFYNWVPNFCDLDYSETNYESIIYFMQDIDGKEKIKKLKSIVKNSAKNEAIDICLTILKIHENHHNNLENEAEEILIKFGNEVVPKVIKLFQYPEISTCTITKCANILATIKDPRGFQPLVDYLPNMVNMPFTIIPPSVPSMLVKFDREKGSDALIKFILEVIRNEKQMNLVDENQDPLSELNLFTDNMFYFPLKDFDRKEIIKKAKNMLYTDSEIQILLGRIYGN